LRSSSIAKAHSVVGICVALSAFALIAILDRVGVLTGSFFEAMVTKWSIFLFVVIWATRVEGLSLSSLGLKRPTVATFGWALVALLSTFVALGIHYRLVAPLFGAIGASSVVGAIASEPIETILFRALSAGIVEEWVFRFYPISRLYWLTGNKWLASIIPMIVFVGVHIPRYGVGQVIPVTLGAVVLTVLYWLRGEYWCNALAHFLVDLSAFLSVSLLAHHSP
jgi:CAAX protease family protein